MAKKERNSNIELLRILSVMGVIVLHYNNPLIGKGIIFAKEGSVNFYILYLLESVFACSVNLFMLISGYFMCKLQKRSLWRLVELIFQVMVFQEAIYLVRVAFRVETFQIKSVLTSLIPANYFVILYCAVFLISPFINILLNGLTLKSFRMFIIISIVLFSIYPTIVDVLGELRGNQFAGLSTIGMYGSQYGYQIVNFLLMYLIGASFNKGGHSKLADIESWKLVLFLTINAVLIIIWARVNDKIGYFTERSAWEYCNPLIIFEAMIIFVLFSRLKVGVNKIINNFSDAVFTVFLLHQVFVPYLNIEKFVNSNTFIMIFHIFSSMIGIYLICWCVHKVYQWITNPIFNKLSLKYNIMFEIEN